MPGGVEHSYGVAAVSRHNQENRSAFLEHFLPSVPRRNPSVSQEHVTLESAQVHLSSQPPFSVSHGLACPICARFSLAKISRLNSNKNDFHNILVSLSYFFLKSSLDLTIIQDLIN